MFFSVLAVLAGSVHAQQSRMWQEMDADRAQRNMQMQQTMEQAERMQQMQKLEQIQRTTEAIAARQAQQPTSAMNQPVTAEVTDPGTVLDRTHELPSSTKLREAEATIAALEKQNQELFNALVDASQEKAVLYWPMLKDPNHPINARAAEIWDRAEAAKDPLVTTANAPFLVYKAAAESLGIAPAISE